MSTPEEFDRAPLAQHAMVSATGRLHLGFLDPGACLGRRFGSLGLVIDGPATTIELGVATRDSAVALALSAANDLLRLRQWLAQLRQASGIDATLALTLHEALPSHAGFGSGTQLALALGRAFATLHGLPWSGADIAAMLGRGGRSGIGIAGFEHGGLLVDGGPRAPGGPPPVLARFDFPESWRVVLILDRSRVGLHGNAERLAIQALPPFPRHLAADLCHRVLMQILPAAAEQDFGPFAEGVNQLQQTIGSYFAPAQGGIHASPEVSRLLQWLAQQGPGALGQSSWGPTGFAILPSQDEAEAAVAAARAAGMLEAPLQVRIVRGRNSGAHVVHPVPAAQQRNAA